MEDISTANSSLDGTGAIGTVATGALNGTRLSSLSNKAVGNTVVILDITVPPIPEQIVPVIPEVTVPL